MIAAKEGRKECVEMLVKAGADLQAQNLVCLKHAGLLI